MIIALQFIGTFSLLFAIASLIIMISGGLATLTTRNQRERDFHKRFVTSGVKVFAVSVIAYLFTLLIFTTAGY